MQPDIIIRPYRVSDREAVRSLAYRTAFMGETAEAFFPYEQLFSDWLMNYYTDFEPQSLFVAEDANRVIGYLSGCADNLIHNKIFDRKIVPGLAMPTLRFVFSNAKARRLMFCLLKSFLRGEFIRPDFNRLYPAHLHLNIEAGYRGKGIGHRLLEKFFEFLKSRNSAGVQAWTFSPLGKILFERSGFKLLYRQRITYFDHLLKDELYLHGYGKKLGEGEEAGVVIG